MSEPGEGGRSVKRIFCALLFSGPKEEGWKAADDSDESGESRASACISTRVEGEPDLAN